MAHKGTVTLTNEKAADNAATAKSEFIRPRSEKDLGFMINLFLRLFYSAGVLIFYNKLNIPFILGVRDTRKKEYRKPDQSETIIKFGGGTYTNKADNDYGPFDNMKDVFDRINLVINQSFKSEDGRDAAWKTVMQLKHIPDTDNMRLIILNCLLKQFQEMRLIVKDIRKAEVIFKRRRTFGDASNHHDQYFLNLNDGGVVFYEKMTRPKVNGVRKQVIKLETVKVTEFGIVLPSCKSKDPDIVNSRVCISVEDAIEGRDSVLLGAERVPIVWSHRKIFRMAFGVESQPIPRRRPILSSAGKVKKTIAKDSVPNIDTGEIYEDIPTDIIEARIRNRPDFFQLPITPRVEKLSEAEVSKVIPKEEAEEPTPTARLEPDFTVWRDQSQDESLELDRQRSVNGGLTDAEVEEANSKYD